MSNRILLPVVLLAGIIIGAVAFRPMAVVNAQQAAQNFPLEKRIGAPQTLPAAENVPVDTTARQVKLPATEPAPAVGEKPVAKWEHLVVKIGGRTVEQKAMDDAESMGYELVAVAVNEGNGVNPHTAYFKRPAKEAAAPTPMPGGLPPGANTGAGTPAIDPSVKPATVDPIATPADAKPVVKWEYKTIYDTRTDSLNAVAAEGYEMHYVSVAVNESGSTRPTVIFKRRAK